MPRNKKELFRKKNQRKRFKSKKLQWLSRKLKRVDSVKVNRRLPQLQEGRLKNRRKLLRLKLLLNKSKQRKK